MQNLNFMPSRLSPVSIHVFTLKYIHGRGAGVRAQQISRELLKKRVLLSHSEAPGGTATQGKSSFDYRILNET